MCCIVEIDESNMCLQEYFRNFEALEVTPKLCKLLFFGATYLTYKLTYIFLHWHSRNDMYFSEDNETISEYQG